MITRKDDYGFLCTKTALRWIGVREWGGCLESEVRVPRCWSDSVRLDNMISQNKVGFKDLQQANAASPQTSRVRVYVGLNSVAGVLRFAS